MICGSDGSQRRQSLSLSYHEVVESSPQVPADPEAGNGEFDLAVAIW
jgi:hypothetical protein